MKAATTNISATINSTVATCPACGLLCDDVLVGNNQQQIKVLANGCAKTTYFFEQSLNITTPQINAKPANMHQAVSYVAKLLKASRQPLFAGLGTDVAGFRSLFHLSENTNATLQHMNAPSTARNMKVLQSSGWQTTTLTEVKNRADVIVCFGDIAKHNPRFFERFVWVENAMFTDAQRRDVIMIGENLDIKAGISPNGAPQSLLACRVADLPEITLVLRALVAGKKLKIGQVAGIKICDLQAVADKLKAAKYAVLTWVAKDLDFNHAELTIQNITETVAILNNTTRAAGLPLGGSDGDTSANNANTWLSGITLNDEVAEHDCVIWVNSFSPEKILSISPPKTDTPLIVIGNSNCEFLQTPEVFIPIATPGLDCSGTLFRVDSSVVLPLKKVRENSLPTLAQVISQIEAALLDDNLA